jgi:hypothetical protein
MKPSYRSKCQLTDQAQGISDSETNKRSSHEFTAQFKRVDKGTLELRKEDSWGEEIDNHNYDATGIYSEWI